VIYVCSLADMPAQVRATRSSHLVSLVPAADMPATPAELAPERHLRLIVDDITAPLPGKVLPSAEHVRTLIDFVEHWDRRKALLVHCFAGISRSMAAALIVLALEAEGREAQAARWLRRHARHAQPNARMIALADGLLGREGRLLAALEAMAPPVQLIEPAPVVHLPLPIES